MNKPSRLQLVRLLLALLIMGLAIYWLVSQLDALEDSVNVIRLMPLGLLGLAAVAQLGSYLGSGYLLKVIADWGQARVSLVRGVLITLASNSMGVLAGGGVGTAAATYHWLAKRKDHPEAAALAGLLPMLYNNILLTIVAIIGLSYLLLTRQLSSVQMAGTGVFLGGLALGLAGLLYSLYHPQVTTRLILGVATPWLRRLRGPKAVDAFRTRLEHASASLTLFRHQGWERPTLGAALNVGFDMLTLYLLFIATGQAASLGIFLAGYSLAFLLERASYLFPGGVGMVEGGMTAIYTSLGIPPSISAGVVLSYRLFSFWIPIGLGLAVAAYLQRTPAPLPCSAPTASPLHPTRDESSGLASLF